MADAGITPDIVVFSFVAVTEIEKNVASVGRIRDSDILDPAVVAEWQTQRMIISVDVYSHALDTHVLKVLGRVPEEDYWAETGGKVVRNSRCLDRKLSCAVNRVNQHNLDLGVVFGSDKGICTRIDAAAISRDAGAFHRIRENIRSVLLRHNDSLSSRHSGGRGYSQHRASLG